MPFYVFHSGKTPGSVPETSRVSTVVMVTQSIPCFICIPDASDNSMVVWILGGPGLACDALGGIIQGPSVVLASSSLLHTSYCKMDISYLMNYVRSVRYTSLHKADVIVIVGDVCN